MSPLVCGLCVTKLLEVTTSLGCSVDPPLLHPILLLPPTLTSIPLQDLSKLSAFGVVWEKKGQRKILLCVDSQISLQMFTNTHRRPWAVLLAGSSSAQET